MDTELNARGIVIGDRYRVAGTLRRTGMIEAVDLAADRGAAACRIVGIPGDAAAVDAWEHAWRLAERPACLPRLLEVVTDEEGVAWAAFVAAEAADSALPLDARHQASAIGVALAKVGLDVADITSAMLVANRRGQLIVDGIPFLGGAYAPRTAAECLMALLPADQDIAIEPDWVEQPRQAGVRRRSGSRSRRRLVVPGAIVVVLIAAAVALLVPAGSAGTPATGESIEAPAADVLLGDVAHPVVALEPNVTLTVTAAAPSGQEQQLTPTVTTTPTVAETVAVDVTPSVPTAAVHSLPLAEPTAAVALPANGSAPTLPLSH